MPEPGATAEKGGVEVDAIFAQVLAAPVKSLAKLWLRPGPFANRVGSGVLAQSVWNALARAFSW